MNYCKIFLYIYCYLHLFKANLDMFTRNGALLIFVYFKKFSPYLAEDGRNLYGLCAPRCMGCFFLCIYVCAHVLSFDFDFERQTVLYIV